MDRTEYNIWQAVIKASRRPSILGLHRIFILREQGLREATSCSTAKPRWNREYNKGPVIIYETSIAYPPRNLFLKTTHHPVTSLFSAVILRPSCVLSDGLCPAAKSRYAIGSLKSWLVHKVSCCSILLVLCACSRVVSLFLSCL